MLIEKSDLLRMQNICALLESMPYHLKGQKELLASAQAVLWAPEFYKRMANALNAPPVNGESPAPKSPLVLKKKRK